MLYVLREGKPIECRNAGFSSEEEFREVLANLVNHYPEILIPRCLSGEKPHFFSYLRNSPLLLAILIYLELIMKAQYI